MTTTAANQPRPCRIVQALPILLSWAHYLLSTNASKAPLGFAFAPHYSATFASRTSLCQEVINTAQRRHRFLAGRRRVVVQELVLVQPHRPRTAGLLPLRSSNNGSDNDDEEEELPPSTVNAQVALSAARKVSSAHLDNFRIGGTIVLRRVLSWCVHRETKSGTSVEQQTTIEIEAFSVAAGIACRLLGSPAVHCYCCPRRRLRQSLGGNVVDGEDATTSDTAAVARFVHIALPLDDDGVAELCANARCCTGGRTSENNAVDLFPGDLWARSVAAAGKEETIASDDEIASLLAGDKDETTTTTRRQPHGGLRTYLFAAVNANDPIADFEDPLFNARGETPTTVIQWSKGTIF